MNFETKFTEQDTSFDSNFTNSNQNFNATFSGVQVINSGGGSYNPGLDIDLSEYAKKTDLPTRVSELTNDVGFATEQFVEQKISEAELSGGSGTSTATVAKIGTVNLLASKWTGKNNLYSQVVNIVGVTENSQVDLTPSVEQLVVFYEKDLTLVTENEDGVVTVYAIGQKPENDYTIQVTITEVRR